MNLMRIYGTMIIKAWSCIPNEYCYVYIYKATLKFGSTSILRQMIHSACMCTIHIVVYTCTCLQVHVHI